MTANFRSASTDGASRQAAAPEMAPGRGEEEAADCRMAKTLDRMDRYMAAFDDLPDDADITLG